MDTGKGMKKLKFFNGRGLGKWTRSHLYVAAYSQKHAVELLKQANGGVHDYCGISEIRNYWSPCWGTAMQKTVPNPDGPGVWVMHDEWSKNPIVKRLV